GLSPLGGGPTSRRTCDLVYRRASRSLKDYRGARGCFEWDANIVRKRSDGLPDQRKPQLRAWLEGLVAAYPGFHGVPLEPPRTEEGQISVRPDYWGELIPFHPWLRAWAQLWAAASTLNALGRVEGDARPRPRYEVVPRLRSMGPDLGQIRRFSSSPVFE